MVIGKTNIITVLRDSGCSHWRLYNGINPVGEYTASDAQEDSLAKFTQILNLQAHGHYKVAFTAKDSKKNGFNWKNDTFVQEFEILPAETNNQQQNQPGIGASYNTNNSGFIGANGMITMTQEKFEQEIVKRVDKEKQIITLETRIEKLEKSGGWDRIGSVLEKTLPLLLQQQPRPPVAVSSIGIRPPLSAEQQSTIENMMNAEIEKLTARCDGDNELLLLRFQSLNKKLDDGFFTMEMLD